jgi:hypothetical protein
MMTDQELLTYAAKAVGISLEWDYDPAKWQPEYYEGKTYHSFDPLTSDADAFRLMVKLSIRVRPYVGNEDDFTTITFDDHDRMTLDHNGDALAATRRLITMAAAEIGKGM